MRLCGIDIRYRYPVPRGDTIEMLAVDDHICIQRLPISEFSKEPILRDSQIFAASQEAYKRVGLVQHERKRKRNATQGVLL